MESISAGDGVNFPLEGDLVSVHYVGTCHDRIFDSSRKRGYPLQFNINRGQVIECWDLVISRMSLGERISFVCPSALAYGSVGAGSRIPPNADIAFDVEMLDFETEE